MAPSVLVVCCCLVCTCSFADWRVEVSFVQLFFLPRCFFQPIFLPTLPPPPPPYHLPVVLFFTEFFFSVTGASFVYFMCGDSWLGFAVVPAIGALFQSRGWLPKV